MKVGLLNEFPSHYQRKIIKKTWEIIQEILRLRCKGLLKWKCLPEGIHFLWDFLIATMFCLYFHWRLISYSLLHGWGQGCLCHKQSTPLGWPGDVPQYNSLREMSYHKWRKLLNWHFDQSWDPLWLGNNYVCRIEYCHFDQKLDNLHEKNLKKKCLLTTKIPRTDCQFYLLAVIHFFVNLSWESTEVARDSLGCTSSISYPISVRSELSTCILNWMDTH